MKLDEASIRALMDASERFLRSCEEAVAEQERIADRVRRSGNDAVAEAERTRDRFAPVIREMEKIRDDHRYALAGVEDLIAQEERAINDATVKKQSFLQQEADCRERAATARSLAASASDSAASVGEDGDRSGYDAAAAKYEADASEWERQADQFSALASQCEREIHGHEVLRDGYVGRKQQIQVSLKQLENDISAAKCRENEAAYRCDQLKSSVRAAIEAAERSLAEAIREAESAKELAARMARRAEEVLEALRRYGG